MNKDFFTPERLKLIGIFNNTMRLVDAEDIEKIVKNSEAFTEDDDISFVQKHFDTKIFLDNKDTFDKAQEMGSDVSVLNMASFKNAGGGVRIGSHAQEECLCRRSNLYPVLKTFVYPLPMVSTVFTPGITVYKSADYKILKTPFQCNVLSAAMCKLKHDEEFNSRHHNLAKKKIEHLLKTALHFEQRRLVLGAWGCGAYHCPPDEMAQIFKEVLFSPQFANQFEEICFAILDLFGKNYQAFNTVFNKS